MAKLITFVVLAMLWSGVAAAGDATPGRTVNLNQPGALVALQLSNPAHYEKVRKILEGVLRQPDTGVPHWIRTNFDGRDVRYVPILLASDPPKRRLSFALDATRYDAVVIFDKMRGEIIPLK